MSKAPVVAQTEPTERYVGPAQPAPSAPQPPPATDATVAAATGAPAFVPKVYAPEDIACPHQNADLTNCGAGAGEPCNWQETGMAGTCHAERIADADAASQRDGIKPTTEQFDQAARDSGLF